MDFLKPIPELALQKIKLLSAQHLYLVPHTDPPLSTLLMASVLRLGETSSSVYSKYSQWSPNHRLWKSEKENK